MNGRLAGRRAIVTGAGSGMGRATAERFVAEGARVLATDINEAGLAALGDAIVTMVHDVADEDAWARVADTARERLGGCDILVNCAAIFSGQSIEDVSLATWNRLMAINLTGTMLGCQTGIALMKDAGRPAAIVNVASTTSFAGLPGDAAYTASKGAVRMLTKSVAAHCGRAGYAIRCNALAPGATDTGMLDVSDDVRGAMAAMALVGRIAAPEEMAAAIVFLVSDESAFMTGTELLMDGGALAVHPGFEMKLESKVAAVTGGSGGIGRAIAEALFAEGASVALFARGKKKGEAALAEMGAGERGLFVAGDAMAQGDVEGFVDATIARFGRIDILVNNAGGAGDLQPLVNLSDAAFDEAMKWNVYANFWASRRALPSMIANEWGRIINISSIEGKHGKAVLTAYTAAKHAVNGLTKSLAREVGTNGVTVNAICPGLVITDIVRNNGPRTAAAMGMDYEAMIAMFAADSAIKRPNTVEEVAAMALLLASPEGAGITGAILSVDGGTAQY